MSHLTHTPTHIPTHTRTHLEPSPGDFEQDGGEIEDRPSSDPKAAAVPNIDVSEGRSRGHKLPRRRREKRQREKRQIDRKAQRNKENKKRDG